MFKIKKGLNLPIEGEPEQKIYDGPKISKIGIVAADFVGMKPTMHVNVGDKVLAGQLLFSDKKTEGVHYTSPVAGTVLEINRGARRAFESIVLSFEGHESVEFHSYKGSSVADYQRESLQELLIESGLWTSLRTRPYSKVANPASTPRSIFVTAMDTNPLSPDAEVIIEEYAEAFRKGMEALAKFEVPIHLCTGVESKLKKSQFTSVKHHEFSGPHPAGLVGTHIHFIDPVSMKKFVWHIGYQDVIAIGKLLETGKLFANRIISIAGPMARHPRLIKTYMGASISDLVAGEIFEKEEIRKVSGSILGGRKAEGPFDYLGKFHYQVSLIKEDRERHFLGWQSIGLNKFSVKPIFLSRFFKNKKYAFATNTNGSVRSIVPIGSYEKVMPLDILPTHLLRYIMARDTEMCIKLGALELDEEDLALCAFVDPCKNDFGPELRANLTAIEKDG